MKVPEWFACLIRAKERAAREPVVLLEIPVCAKCLRKMSATPRGLRCFGCGGDRVKR
jgi:hypothetical protein